MVAIMAREIEVKFDWRAYAACEGIEKTDTFFGEDYGATYGLARMYCSTCPVVIDCLIEGIEDQDNIGMWGCTSPNERTQIRSWMDEGFSLKESVEAIWQYEREKVRGVKVPPKRVWRDWDA